MKYFLLAFCAVSLCSCWKWRKQPYGESVFPKEKVWGSKPVYAAESDARQISYVAQKKPMYSAGNIYAFGHFIFQVDYGRGIHVIDNSVPAQADRVGFINVQGCSQISMKGHYIYTNSYDDLVTLDITDPANLREVSRVRDAFPEYRYNYPLAQPSGSGYYICPRTDSMVVGWTKDSIYATCIN